MVAVMAETRYVGLNRLMPQFHFGRYVVEADSRAEAIGKVVSKAGAGVLDTIVINNGDGTWTVRYATR